MSDVDLKHWNTLIFSYIPILTLFYLSSNKNIVHLYIAQTASSLEKLIKLNYHNSYITS